MWMHCEKCYKNMDKYIRNKPQILNRIHSGSSFCPQEKYAQMVLHLGMFMDKFEYFSDAFSFVETVYFLIIEKRMLQYYEDIFFNFIYNNPHYYELFKQLILDPLIDCKAIDIQRRLQNIQLCYSQKENEKNQQNYESPFIFKKIAEKNKKIFHKSQQQKKMFQMQNSNSIQTTTATSNVSLTDKKFKQDRITIDQNPICVDDDSFGFTQINFINESSNQDNKRTTKKPNYNNLQSINQAFNTMLTFPPPPPPPKVIVPIIIQGCSSPTKTPAVSHETKMMDKPLTIEIEPEDMIQAIFFNNNTTSKMNKQKREPIDKENHMQMELESHPRKQSPAWFPHVQFPPPRSNLAGSFMSSIQKPEFFPVPQCLQLNDGEEMDEVPWALKDTSTFCDVCCKMIREGNLNIYSLTHCHHTMHFTCAQKYFRTKMYQKYYPLKCPNKNCQVLATEIDIVQVSSPDQLEKYFIEISQGSISMQQQQVETEIKFSSMEALIEDDWLKKENNSLKSGQNNAPSLENSQVDQGNKYQYDLLPMIDLQKELNEKNLTSNTGISTNVNQWPDLNYFQPGVVCPGCRVLFSASQSSLIVAAKQIGQERFFTCRKCSNSFCIKCRSKWNTDGSCSSEKCARQTSKLELISNQYSQKQSESGKFQFGYQCFKNINGIECDDEEEESCYNFNFHLP